MPDSIFTKIIKGELPSSKVYEDQKTIVIVPLHPIAKGHVLAIPKTQVDHFMDLPDQDYQALMATVKKTAHRMKQVLQTERIGLKVVGLDVPHAHIHIIAFDTLDEYNQSPDESAPPEFEKMAQLAKQLEF